VLFNTINKINTISHQIKIRNIYKPDLPVVPLFWNTADTVCSSDMHFHLDVTINFKKQYLQHKLHNLFSNVKRTCCLLLCLSSMIVFSSLRI